MGEGRGSFKIQDSSLKRTSWTGRRRPRRHSKADKDIAAEPEQDPVGTIALRPRAERRATRSSTPAERVGIGSWNAWSQTPLPS